MAVRKTDRIRQKARGYKTGAYIGFKALTIILWRLKTAKHTPQRLCELTGTSLRLMRCLLKQLLELQLVDRVGWEPVAHGFPAPIYRAGEGERVPAPLNHKGLPQAYADFKPRLQPRVVAFASAIQSIQLGASSLNDICHESGLAPSRASVLLRELHARKMVHVAGWIKPKATPIYRLWAWGEAEDAPKPLPLEKRRVRVRREAKHVGSSWASTVVQMKRNAGIHNPSCRATATA